MEWKGMKVVWYLLTVGEFVDHGSDADTACTSSKGQRSSDVIETRSAHDRDGYGARDGECCSGYSR